MFELSVQDKQDLVKRGCGAGQGVTERVESTVKEWNERTARSVEVPAVLGCGGVGPTGVYLISKCKCSFHCTWFPQLVSWLVLEGMVYLILYVGFGSSVFTL